MNFKNIFERDSREKISISEQGSPTLIPDEKKPGKAGLVIASLFGTAGLALVSLSAPFILPALRRHCLPYVPATDSQLSNLTKAFKRHAKKGGQFLDIGSGDGRICRLVARQKLFNQIHGVELNYPLVIFSRIMAIKNGRFNYEKYHHRDLWKFPLGHYDAICIFGVESMMNPLQEYLIGCSTKPQTIFACRFPFNNLSIIDKIGEGVDTVWIYKINNKHMR